MPNAPQIHRPAGYQPPAQRERQWASRTAESRKWYASPEWKELRLAALSRDNWLCQDCMGRGITTPLSRGKEAKDKGTVAHADHIRPHRGDRDLFFDLDNVQSLCPMCHSRKTAKEDGGFGHKRK
jgi:5-methylcytosine-specific restriction protein A